MVLFKWTLTIATEAYYKNYGIQSAVPSFASLKSESFCHASAIKSCHKKFMNEKVFARNLINKFSSAIAQSLWYMCIANTCILTDCITTCRSLNVKITSTSEIILACWLLTKRMNSIKSLPCSCIHSGSNIIIW